MADPASPDGPPTLRIVLKHLNKGAQPEHNPEQWQVIGTAHGSKKQAIEKFAGKDGKDKPGTYRAPSLRSWKGEVTYEPDPEPRMNAKWVD